MGAKLWIFGGIVALVLWANLLPDSAERQARRPKTKAAIEQEQRAGVNDFVENYKIDAHKQRESMLDIVRFFEGTERDGYATRGHTDGLSVGMIQMNVHPSAQTLNYAVNHLITKHSQVARNVLGGDYAHIRNVFRRDASYVYRYFLNRTNYDRYAPAIARLMATEPGVEIQVRDMNARYERAGEISNMYGFESMRAMTYAFDKMVQWGGPSTEYLFATALQGFDKSQVNLDTIYTDYFMKKYSKVFNGRLRDQASFLDAKYWFLENLRSQGGDNALMEYYMLNLVDDATKRVKSHIDDKRGRTILTLDARRNDNGTWIHGHTIYQTFHTPNQNFLNQKRKCFSKLHNSMITAGHNPNHDQARYHLDPVNKIDYMFIAPHHMRVNTVTNNNVTVRAVD